MVRIAVFTDTDLNLTTDLTAALSAVMRHAPDDLHARIFTAADLPADTEDYFAAASVSVPVPWDRRQRIFWPRIWPFARQLGVAGADVIHIATAGPVGLTGRWLARRLRIPVVGSVHAPQSSSRDAGGLRAHGGALGARLSRWAYDSCTPLLVPSRAARERWSARGFSRLETWPRGVDTRTFAPHRASAALRDAWHVDHRRPAIVIPLASLTKAELSMIDPIRRRLHRHAIAHQFVFVGTAGPTADVEAVSTDGVFIDDPYDDQLAIAIASADLYLFPGCSDMPGGFVLEAQASGLPAIVADSGGAVEQIVPDRTGCVFRAGDVDDLAAKLIALLRHAGRRVHMGQAARAHAMEREWPAMLSPLHEAWRAAGRLPRIAQGRVTSNEAA